jgi:adenine-specific DNA-methyltransferase
LHKTEPASLQCVWPNEAGSSSLKSNSVYFGDNLKVLATLSKDKKFKGKVKLVYIDPPFATNKVFNSRSLRNAYEDTLVGWPYIEFMRERLIHLKELLSEDGSIYVHIDDNMLFELKMIMDEIFGRKNFRNLIVRKKSNPKNYTKKQYGNIADYILFYAKTANNIWNKPYSQWAPEELKSEYPYLEEATGRYFKKVPIHAPGIRNGDTGLPWKGLNPPPGKHWQYKRKTLDEMDARGEIFWSSNGNPRRKIYLDTNQGKSVQDIWMDFKDAHNQNIKITGYPTEKNPLLLERIIEASSNEGDLILDCFAGSGTTLGAAAKLKRKWIGIDSSIEALDATITRFKHGLKPMGDYVAKRNSLPLKLVDVETPNKYLSDFRIYADVSMLGEELDNQVKRLSLGD